MYLSRLYPYHVPWNKGEGLLMKHKEKFQMLMHKKPLDYYHILL